MAFSKSESKAHAQGYEDGFNEARAEWLTKFAKWLDRGDTKKVMRERVTYHAEKAKENGRWPEGW